MLYVLDAMFLQYHKLKKRKCQLENSKRKYIHSIYLKIKSPYKCTQSSNLLFKSQLFFKIAICAVIQNYF